MVISLNPMTHLGECSNLLKSSWSIILEVPYPPLAQKIHRMSSLSSKSCSAACLSASLPAKSKWLFLLLFDKTTSRPHEESKDWACSRKLNGILLAGATIPTLSEGWRKGGNLIMSNVNRRSAQFKVSKTPVEWYYSDASTGAWIPSSARTRSVMLESSLAYKRTAKAPTSLENTCE